MQIELAEPDPQWPTLFSMEQKRLAQALLPLAMQIEHIGSTSVPGLVAKPVIDIQVGVSNLQEFEAESGIGKLQQLGYEYFQHFNEFVPFRRFFARSEDDVRLNNLHLVAMDHPWRRRHLMFRDYLRQNPEARDRYTQAKRDLAQRDWNDVNDYAGAKTTVVLELEEQAFDYFGLPGDERDWIRSSRI